MPRPHRTATPAPASWLCTFALAMGVLAGPAVVAEAKTFCFPHVFDQKGRTSNTPFTFDTSMFMTYSPALGSPSPGATVDLYLYDNSGLAMRGQGGGDVCNPCSYSLGGGSPRKLSLSVEELIDAAGSFTGIKLGFGIIVVGGADPDNVAVQGYIVNSHATPGTEVSSMPVEPDVIGDDDDCDGTPDTRRVLVLPHVLEVSGSITNTQYSFDTTIFADYVGGRAGTPAGAGATVDLYLLDDNGGFLVGGGGGDVCAPCTFHIDAVTPKVGIGLEALIDAAGGFGPLGSMEGTALLDVSGDPDLVSIQAFVVNAHTSPSDVSVFGFNPQEITAPGPVAGVIGEAGAGRLSLGVAPNPTRAGGGGSGVTLSFDLPAAASLELAIFDVNGRQVATVARGLHAAGAHRVAWNGLDESGAAVSPGVYFAKLTDASGSATSRIVAIR